MKRTGLTTKGFSSAVWNQRTPSTTPNIDTRVGSPPKGAIAGFACYFDTHFQASRHENHVPLGIPPNGLIHLETVDAAGFDPEVFLLILHDQGVAVNHPGDLSDEGFAFGNESVGEKVFLKVCPASCTVGAGAWVLKGVCVDYNWCGCTHWENEPRSMIRRLRIGRSHALSKSGFDYQW